MKDIIRKKVFITTFLIKQMHCDSSCAYCYLLRGKNINSTYKYEGPLAKDLDGLLDFSVKYFDSPILKLCGGEIFMMDNLKDYVMHLLSYYPYVLIQTNGRLIQEKDLHWIINSKRVLLQISLDGHCIEMNKFRFKDDNVLQKLLHSISILKQNDVYVEITSVIHKFNIKKIKEFMLYLDSLPYGKVRNKLKFTPLLLIDEKGIYQHTKEDIIYIEELLEKYDQFENILPPFEYMNTFLSKLKGEKPNYSCLNPMYSLTLTDEGDVKGCTNVLSIDQFNVGNIFREEHEFIINKFGKTKFQKLLLNTIQKIPVCKTCYNFCKIYNLYLNDTITLNELCINNAMYDLPEVKQHLIEIKNSAI